ncbi:hypothetical protein WJX73_004438 [Symbiochloris irregularis]|uniref:Uncharacterized protein n=1 Tax=Symbiochloris irregularis TaxID=706552 RepID=A0AAW1NWG9_9CHLO
MGPLTTPFPPDAPLAVSSSLAPAPSTPSEAALMPHCPLGTHVSRYTPHMPSHPRDGQPTPTLVPLRLPRHPPNIRPPHLLMPPRAPSNGPPTDADRPLPPPAAPPRWPRSTPLHLQRPVPFKALLPFTPPPPIAR